MPSLGTWLSVGQVFTFADSSRSHDTRTLTHLRPGPSGVTGLSSRESAGSEEADVGLLRAHWIIGPPFVDPRKTFLPNFVCKTLSPIAPLKRLGLS
jgi:hypothetical protein